MQPSPPHPRAHADDLGLTLLPWVVSIMLHLGIVLLAAIAIWSVKAQIESQQVIIPMARLSATPGTPLSEKTGDALTTAAINPRARGRSPALLSGPSQAAAPGQGSAGLSSLAGPGAADASADGDNPFGEGIEDPQGTRATFYGNGGNAHRLVYMVDASGALIDTLPLVFQELDRSIARLSDQQQFTVLFFQGNTVKEIPPAGLKPATAANKTAAIRWMDLDAAHVVPMGASNPVIALRAALRYRPELLFLLSGNITGQGRYEIDQQRLLTELADTNEANTTINTYQFIYPDPLAQFGLKGTMQQIAEKTGGIYKFLTARDLGLQ